MCMSEDNLFDYDDLVEFIAEFIMVYEASRISPHVYIQSIIIYKMSKNVY